MLLDLFDFRNLLFVFLVFVPLELILPFHPEQKLVRRAWLQDLLHYFFSGILIKIGLVVLITGTMALSSLIVPTALRDAVLGLPLWLQCLLIVVIGDLGFYAAHRMFHSIPWLWHFHAVHHSIEDMDWLAAHRVHPVDQIVTKGASLIPIFVLGFSEVAIGITVAIYHWHSLLLHSNVRLPFGPLRWLVASPDFHHWHHANQPEAYDKNFSGQLPLWDIVFGTLHMPGNALPERYGVDDPVPRTYHGQLAYPFLRVARHLHQWARPHGRGPSPAADDPPVMPPEPGTPLDVEASRRF